MGEFLALAHSSIMLPHNIQVRTWSRTQCCFGRYQRMSIMPLSVCVWTGPPRNIFMQPKQMLLGISAVSDSMAPTTFTVDSAGGGYDVLPDSGGGGDGFGDSSGKGGNGGNNGGNEGGSEEEGKDQNGESGKKKAILSMSQKLTLGYALLVGAGGVMGYLKSGSLKSLIAGGVSASLLYYVYNMLPTNPVLASSVGFVLSAGLLGVMGLRFMKSKKMFPAGVVSIASFIMTGGYLHGMMRSVH